MSVLRYGLITDIQHADKDTVEFDGRPQRYRESAPKLEAALSDFAQHQQRDQHLEFVLTLGDIIDGYPGDAAKTSQDLQLVASLFRSSLPGLPVHHVLGNHCLTASRDELLQALQMPGSYYSMCLGHGWRLVVLDTTEMSLHSGYPEGSSQMDQAHAWLAAHPLSQYPNAETWNGGCTQQQLDWLQEQLTDAGAQQQQVIVACHHPIAPGSAPDRYLAWDFDKLQHVLHNAPAGTVRCVFSGHYHPGGYVLHNGVHYVVFEGVLEAPAGSNAYAVVEVWPGKLIIEGRGVCTSRELLF